MRDRYMELKDNSEYERVVKEYNNHYGYDLNSSEHHSNNIDKERVTHLNIVNDISFLKKR